MMTETLEMIAFGPFCLDTEHRQLRCGGAPVALSSRGFDILVLLAENRGRVVGKDEIMTRVWRGMIVEENNLAVQVSALRRALAHAASQAGGRAGGRVGGQAGTQVANLAGDGGEAPVIQTVPGQGYRFVARMGRGPVVDTAPVAALPRMELLAEGPPPPLPAPLPIGLPTALSTGLSTGLPTGLPTGTRPGPCAVECAPAPPMAPGRRGMVVMVTLAACVVGLGGMVLLRAPYAPQTARMAVPETARVTAPGAMLGAAPGAAANSASPPRLSIAVLPFRDLSDDRCCDYLADAISDDLTTDLSLLPGSVVIARESADVYRNHPMPAAAIGQALNVRYLLEGSLRSVDGIFSINAQLIEASSGGHLWAERFTVPRDHLAQAQEAIVQRLASALGVKLVAIEGARSEHAENPDAMDLFLRARSVLDRSDSLAGMNQAQALLEQARARRPDDVKVLSELGWLLPRKINNYVTPHRAADLAEAREVTARAQALAPGDPAVLSAQAALQLFDGDCGDAQRTFQAALEAQPDAVPALTGLAVCQFERGQFDDAARQLTALLHIDPEGPRQKTRFYQLGFSELMRGHAEAAASWLRKSMIGDERPGPGNADAGAEWKRLALVAATRLAGDRAGSDAMFAAYRAAWPNRSTWALESHAPAIFSALPAFHAFLSALEDAGMARFADERPGPAAGPCGDGTFTPTPHTIAGALTVQTADVIPLIGNAGVAVVDVGLGAAVPPHAVLSNADPASAVDMARVTSMQGQGIVKLVVMGGGPSDPRGCQAAQSVVAAARPRRGMSVLWYRGGEEAWAQSGQGFRDLR